LENQVKFAGGRNETSLQPSVHAQ